jgi:dTDP-4-dehydrorhamnose reductase
MKEFGRVFITGCGGMLGSAIYPHFAARCEKVLATDKNASEPWLTELDVRNDTGLASTFSNFEPDLVLHLAAETDLEFCEENVDVAVATNADATRNVAVLARQHGATLVYVSTAGVFDGRKAECYTERDEPCPIMVYGQTKLDGEDHVREVIGTYYVVRAGWMVGGGPAKDHKFVAKILEQLASGATTVHAVSDRWGTPTYTRDFAHNLFRLLASERHGTYHMVCEGCGTRYDVAREIVAVCNRGEVHVEPVDSDYFAAQYCAPRPRSEMLVNENLVELGINEMRPWRAALRDYIVKEYPHVLARGGNEVGRGARATDRIGTPSSEEIRPFTTGPCASVQVREQPASKSYTSPASATLPAPPFAGARGGRP